MKRQKKGSPRFHFFFSDHYVNLLTSVQTLFSYFPCKLFFWVLLLCQLAGWDKSEVITFCSKVVLEGLIISWLYWDCIVFSTIFPYVLPFVDKNNTFVVLLTNERFASVTTSVTIPSSMMHLLYERILINVWLSLARFLYPSLLLLCEQDKKVTKSYNFTSMSALPCGCQRKKSPKTRDTKSKLFNPYICPCVIIFLSKFEQKSSSKHLISRPSLPHKNNTENWSSPRSTL